MLVALKNGFENFLISNLSNVVLALRGAKTTIGEFDIRKFSNPYFSTLETD